MQTQSHEEIMSEIMRRAVDRYNKRQIALDRRKHLLNTFKELAFMAIFMIGGIAIVCLASIF